MTMYAVPVTRDVDNETVELEVSADSPEKAKRSAAALARHNSDELFSPLPRPSFHSGEPTVKAGEPEPVVEEPTVRAKTPRKTRIHGKLSIRQTLRDQRTKFRSRRHRATA